MWGGVPDIVKRTIIFENRPKGFGAGRLWSYLAPFLRYGDLLAENCQFFLPHSHLPPSFSVNPFEFLDELFIPKIESLASVKIS